MNSKPKATINFSVNVYAENVEDIKGKIEAISTVLKSEGINFTVTPPEAEELFFNARLIRFDDTFHSTDMAKAIWGLAFTSDDVMNTRDIIGRMIEESQPVRITIKGIKEGSE